MKLQKTICTTQRLLKRNGSTILTVIGVCGGVYATVKAVKDTPKALKLIEDAKNAKTNSNEEEKLTWFETAKVTAPIYAVPIVIGISSIACIFGSNVLSRKQQASMASAYALIDHSFKKYRNAAKRVYGEDADERIQKDIMVSEYAKFTDLPHGDLVLFYDSISDRYFYSTPQAVTEAEYHFNRNFALRGYADLNELYDFLGIPETMEGNIMGWSMDYGLAFAGYDWVDFEHREEHMEDGEICYAIVAPYSPTILFTDSEDETDQYDRVPQIEQVI